MGHNGVEGIVAAVQLDDDKDTAVPIDSQAVASTVVWNRQCS